MSHPPTASPSACVGAGACSVYVLTLAPTVTFWDAGEFIAAAKTLGIPHPPGTPLFVLIAHVWGMLVPIGEFAYRTNLLSALLSAAARRASSSWWPTSRCGGLGRLDAGEPAGCSGRRRGGRG